jgi:hypothetical protein
MPALLALFPLVRGTPVLLHRDALARTDRFAFGSSASVPSMGLVVVIAEIGLRSGQMPADVAQAPVGSAPLASLLFPVLSGLLTKEL